MSLALTSDTPPATNSGAPAPALRLAHEPPSARELESWVPIERAAAALGITEGAVRALSRREQWHQRGLAREMGWHASPDGGRPRLHIHRSASPLLIRESSPSSLARAADSIDAYKSAPRVKKQTAAAKAEIVRRWRAYVGEHAGATTEQGFARFALQVMAEYGMRVSRRSLFRWSSRIDSRETAAANLIDRRGGRREVCAIDPSPQAWEAFRALYLADPPLTLASCYRRVASIAEASQWQWPSLTVVRRLVEQRLPPRVRDLARLGETQWRRKHETPIESDADRFAPGELYESDHSKFDLFIRALRGSEWRPVRPWITVWFDWRTRLVVGWHVSLSGNAETIKLALRHALVTRGMSVPVYAKLDNGRDYQSRQLHGEASAAHAARSRRRALVAGSIKPAGPEDEPSTIAAPEDESSHAELMERRARQLGLFGMLGIEVHFGAPYAPNAKARVERFFGTMRQDFDRGFASWRGSRPGQRDTHAVADAVEDVMDLPTLDEFSAAVDRWIEAYNIAPHANIPDLHGLSSADFYARYLPARRTAPEAVLVELTKMVESPRRVTKSGVRITIAGKALHYGSGDPALMELVGTDRAVWVFYDPRDLSSVAVYDESGRHITHAAPNRRLSGMTGDDLKASIAERTRERKAARERAKVDPRYRDVVDEASIKALDRQTQQRRNEIAAAQPSPAPLQLVGRAIEPPPALDEARLAAAARARDAAEVDIGDLLDQMGSDIIDEAQSQGIDLVDQADLAALIDEDTADGGAW